jgi:hypothetical protein
MHLTRQQPTLLALSPLCRVKYNRCFKVKGMD